MMKMMTQSEAKIKVMKKQMIKVGKAPKITWYPASKWERRSKVAPKAT